MPDEEVAVTEGRRKPWEQWDEEPAYWYGRFVIFRDMGPARSLSGAVRIYYRKRNKPAHPANETWCENARVWKWRERALAWDQYQRDLMTLVEANRKAAARERRTAVIGENIDTAREMIRAADLENLSTEEARALFPEARRYLKDMIEADRKEYDKNLYDVEVEAPSDAAPLQITADDLRAAQREFDKREAEKQEAGEAAGGDWTPDRSWKEKAATGTAGRLAKARAERRLIVCPPLEFARSSLPLVHAAGLTCRHVMAATRTKFARVLHLERTLGYPVQLLHVDLRASAAGIEFATNLADPYWLDERLGSVKVLLLGRYAGEEPADWFARVESVVTLREEMAPRDGRRFADAFWAAIGGGKEASAAVEAGLDACGVEAAKYVGVHGAEAVMRRSRVG